MAKEPASKADPDVEEPVDGEAVEGEAGEKKKLPLKLIIIAAVAAVVVLGGGGTAAILLLGHKSPDAAGKSAKPEKKAENKDDKKGGPDKNGGQVVAGPDGVVFYTPPDIVVNMQTADGRPTFLKLKLTFEAPDHETTATLDENMPRLQDMFQTFLRELRPEDLSGSQGSFQLRMEIQRRVNLIIAPAKINSVLIEEMLIN